MFDDGTVVWHGPRAVMNLIDIRRSWRARLTLALVITLPALLTVAVEVAHHAADDHHLLHEHVSVADDHGHQHGEQSPLRAHRHDGTQLLDHDHDIEELPDAGTALSSSSPIHSGPPVRVLCSGFDTGSPALTGATGTHARSARAPPPPLYLIKTVVLIV